MSERKCTKCNETKPIDDFPLIDRRGYRRHTCRDCKNAYLRKRHAEKRGPTLEKAKRDRESLQARVFEHYGGKCADCGEEDYVVLTIDHINDDGAKRRRQGEPKGPAFYRWIEDNKYPDDLQILCRNCNWRKHIRNAQRLSREGVGSSDPKRPAPSTEG